MHVCGAGGAVFAGVYCAVAAFGAAYSFAIAVLITGATHILGTTTTCFAGIYFTVAAF